MDEYARYYNHEPTDNWILVVNADDTSEFYTFEDPSVMWCCDSRGMIRRKLRGAGGATKSSQPGKS